MTVTRQMSLNVVDRPDVLLRVTGACLRRRCPVVAMHFEKGDRHRPGVLELTVAGPQRQLDQLSRWLANLVDVRAVS